MLGKHSSGAFGHEKGIVIAVLETQDSDIWAELILHLLFEALQGLHFADFVDQVFVMQLQQTCSFDPRQEVSNCLCHQ